MKKVIIIFISLFYIPFVYAFNINVDKIEIHTKGESLVSNMDKQYNIEAKDYSSKETINKGIISVIILRAVLLVFILSPTIHHILL